MNMRIWLLFSLLLMAACGAADLPQATPPPAPTQIPIVTRVLADAMPQVWVPEGPFIMGMEDPDDQSRGHAVDLRAPEVVTLPGYWIDQLEVTNGMYQRCVAAGECAIPTRPVQEPRADYFYSGVTRDHPVSGVTWEDAVAYCAWAGRRLPTEAEWEKAARGVDGRPFPWGDANPTCEHANFAPCGTALDETGIRPLGASPYGALDMAGNVQEWTADWYTAADAYATTTPDDETPGARIHVVRGGNYIDEPPALQTAFRFFGWPIDNLTVGYGFRCAADG